MIKLVEWNWAFVDTYGIRVSIWRAGVFEKLPVGVGLLWEVGLTEEIKLRFQIPPP